MLAPRSSDASSRNRQNAGVASRAAIIGQHGQQIPATPALRNSRGFRARPTSGMTVSGCRRLQPEARPVDNAGQ
jgi:hypothetical protein